MLEIHTARVMKYDRYVLAKKHKGSSEILVKLIKWLDFFRPSIVYMGCELVPGISSHVFRVLIDFTNVT